MSRPKEDWQLPASIRAVLPPSALPAPDDDDEAVEFSPAFLSGDDL